MFWFACFGVGFALLLVFLWSVAVLFAKGVGIWGIRTPVVWGFAITNFVWWIGIGHAGTLISAILLLLNQRWRNSINRFAEAMTLFAVACAGMFPLLHLGRPWLFYWLFPYPNTMGVQPQFRSPLVWDVFAVSTYATVSLLFWFVGLMPDLATLRDRTHQPLRALRLRHSGDGLARVGAALEHLRNGLAAAGRPGHAAGALGAHGGQLRLHHRHRARLAQHFLPALFRGGRHLLRVSPWCWRWPFRCARSTAWKGLITDKHLDNSAKVMLATGLDRGLRVHPGNLHRLVQRQRLRERRHLAPHDRAVRAALLVADHLQHRGAAVAVVQEGAQQPGAAVHRRRSSCWSACGWSAS